MLIYINVWRGRFSRKICGNLKINGFCADFVRGGRWMQAVEPRREQAAEVVPIPLLRRGARQGGVVEPRLKQAAKESRRAGRGVGRIARLTLAGITHMWSFPPGGNGLSKPLDSSFRWNDNRGFRLSPGSYGPLQRPVPDLPAACLSRQAGRRGSTQRWSRLYPVSICRNDGRF